MAITPKWWPRVSAVSTADSLMPSTGTATRSRSCATPGSLKQATTKPAASASCRTAKSLTARAAPSTCAWVSTPGGPASRVTHRISGPPARRNGSTAALSCAVTSALLLGLMT